MTSEQNKDTTPLSQIEGESHDIKMYLNVVFNNVQDPLFVKDEECRLLLVNDAFCSIFELTRNEIIGKTLAEKVPQNERDHFLSIDKKVLKEGKEILCEETLTISGKQPKILLTRKSRFVDPKGNYFLVGLVQDITEIKQAENLIVEKEERLSLALRHSKIGIWDLNPQTQELVWDESMYSLYDIKREDFSGNLSAWEHLVHPDDLELANQQLEEAISGKTPFDTEFRVVRRNGEIRRIKAIAKLFYDEGGMPVRLLGINTDVTEQRDAEQKLNLSAEALVESESRYARAVRGTNDGLWEWNVLTNEDYLSPRWKELLGFADDELTNHYGTFSSRVHPDDMSRVNAAIQAHLEQDVPYDIEHRLRTKSDEYLWFSVRGRAERDEQGTAVLMSGTITDITERKLAEKNLQTSEERFKAIYENAPVLINAFDENGRCLLWNKECQKTFGWTIEDVKAESNTLELFYPDPAVRAEVLSTVTTDPDGEFREWHPKTKDGRTLITMWANFRLPDGVTFSLGHDITKRKEAENALVMSLQEKEILLKEIHHRVKNNLQVIVSLLNLQASSEENVDVLDALQDSQRRIGVMAKLHEALYRSENLSTINIRDYLSSLINDLLKSLNIGGLKITNEINIDEIDFDISQSIALGQIVSELISNCFKHAFVGRRSGDIKLTLHRAEDEKIMLTITDDGKGFPENYDIQSSKTLGLKLVKGLAQQLHGSLSIDGGSVKIQFPELKI